MKDIYKIEDMCDVSQVNTGVCDDFLIAFIVLGASPTSSFCPRIVLFYKRQLVTCCRDVPRIERQFA